MACQSHQQKPASLTITGRSFVNKHVPFMEEQFTSMLAKQSVLLGYWKVKYPIFLLLRLISNNTEVLPLTRMQGSSS